MLVHICTDCNSVSINRIAADDDPEAILAVYQSSLNTNYHFVSDQGITMLHVEDMDTVYMQLYGQRLETTM